MKLNLLQFTPATQSIKVNAYTEKVEHKKSLRIFKENYPDIWEQYPEILSEKEFIYCTFENEQTEYSGEKLVIDINLNDNPHFAIPYFRYLIYSHFLGKVPAVSYNFVDGVEIWLEIQKNQTVTKYHKFTLNPQYARVTEGFELLVTFDGQSTVYNKPVVRLTEIEPELFSLVIVNGELQNYRKLNQEQKSSISETYPILNHKLSKLLNYDDRQGINPNKYLSTYKYIHEFCKTQLFTKDFQNLFNFSINDFLDIPEHKIFKTTFNSNVLVFDNNRTDIVPYNGMKNGPFRAPNVSNNNVRFFFIFQRNDFNHVASLNEIFTKGYFKTHSNGQTYKQFPSLAEYINQTFHTEPNGSIVFENLETAVIDVNKGLANKKFVKDCTYIAIYVSPIKKDDVDNPYHNIYYQIKETLLEKGITSQAIYKERHNDEYFSFHLPNIAIALLAKLGGIPWQLQNSGKNDLIVGVGAFRSTKTGKRYVGSAFRFNSDGVFQNFDCHRDNDLPKLVNNIRKALMHYIVEHESAERLIIHYYKAMSRKEAKPIQDMLYRLGVNIPVIIVTINKTETQDIFAFDEEQSDLMPYSGTIVRVGKNQFLLYNNTKYDDSFHTAKGKKDYPFPIKIKITSPDEDVVIDKTLNAELLDQVYKFSRMYWKSVKQQNLPITIKYPEMVAEIVPHFSDADMPPFGKTNLWFL